MGLAGRGLQSLEGLNKLGGEAVALLGREGLLAKEHVAGEIAMGREVVGAVRTLLGPILDQKPVLGAGQVGLGHPSLGFKDCSELLEKALAPPLVGNQPRGELEVDAVRPGTVGRADSVQS